MATLKDLVSVFEFSVLEHLEAEATVPVHSGLQAQGDLFVVPVPGTVKQASWVQVPSAGLAVIRAVGAGHEHRLFAGIPGTAETSALSGQDIAYLRCTEPAYLLHPEHGATGIAPGSYILRRQREQAEEERIVAD